MNLDIGLLARALAARVMQLEAENTQLRAALTAANEEKNPPRAKAAAKRRATP